MYKFKNDNANFVVVRKIPYQDCLEVDEFVHFSGARHFYETNARRGWQTKLFAVCPATGEKVLMWDSNEEG